MEKQKSTYAERWDRKSGSPVLPLDIGSASKRHRDREPYSCLISREGVPFCAIELNATYINVIFLDGLHRNYLEYEFHELEPGRVFFRQSKFHRFSGEERLPMAADIYEFDPAGSFFLVRSNFAAGVARKSETAPFEPSNNWETYPEFDRYAPLLIKERNVVAA